MNKEQLEKQQKETDLAMSVHDDNFVGFEMVPKQADKEISGTVEFTISKGAKHIRYSQKFSNVKELQLITEETGQLFVKVI